jgi:hypothetical protein
MRAGSFKAVVSIASPAFMVVAGLWLGSRMCERMTMGIVTNLD